MLVSSPMRRPMWKETEAHDHLSEPGRRSFGPSQLQVTAATAAASGKTLSQKEAPSEASPETLTLRLCEITFALFKKL